MSLKFLRSKKALRKTTAAAEKKREEKKKADITFRCLMNIHKEGGVVKVVSCYLCASVCAHEKEEDMMKVPI